MLGSFFLPQEPTEMCVGEEQKSVERTGFIPGACPDTKGHQPGNRVVPTSHSGRPRRRTPNPKAGGVGFRKHWSTMCGDAGTQAGHMRRQEVTKINPRAGGEPTSQRIL